MSAGTQSEKRGLAIEIETDGADSSHSFPVPLGAEARIIRTTPPGTGADNYQVKVVGDSIDYRGLVDVRREGVGPQPVGTIRTDVVLATKSLGNSAVEIRAMKGGSELSVEFVSISVVEGPGD